MSAYYCSEWVEDPLGVRRSCEETMPDHRDHYYDGDWNGAEVRVTWLT